MRNLLPWAEAWERNRLLNIYDGLAFRRPPQPKYVFHGLTRHDYEFGPISMGKRKTKSIFLMTPLGGRYYRPIMGASPATYFIKNAGNDGNDGLSDANAWATVSKITSGSFMAGDIIQLKRANTWNENFSVPSSGVEGNPITIQPYDSGAKPIINGQSGSNDAILVDSKTDITLSFLRVVGFALAGTVVIHFDNSPLRSRIEDCEIVGHTTDRSIGIHIEDSPDCTVIGNDVSNISTGIAWERNSGFTGTDISGLCSGNTIHDHTDQDQSESDSIALQGADGQPGVIIIEFNDCSGWNEDGIDCGMPNSIVQNNTVHTNGTLAGDDTRIGIKTRRDDIIVRYNHIHSITGVGTGNAAGINIDAPDGQTYYNVVRDITVSGGVSEGIIVEKTGSTTYNNTIFNVSQFALRLRGTSTLHTVHNNICDGGTFDLQLSAQTPTVTGGFNCLVNDAAAEVTVGSYSGGGDDLGTTDPIFVNAAGENFRLTAASPCRNAGTDVGLTQDFASILVPQESAPDIGAHEYIEELSSSFERMRWPFGKRLGYGQRY